MTGVSGRRFGARRTRIAGACATALALFGSVLLTVTAQPAGAVTNVASVLYVATSAHGGSDLNPCTQAAPCATVQRALDLSSSNGTVHVGAGAFVGGFEVTGPSVTIVGAGQGQTFLDGGKVGTVVEVMQDAVGTQMPYTITDVTVQHANTAVGSGHAGAITLFRGSLELVRVSVTDNAGAGIFLEGGGVSIADSTVAANSGIGLQNFGGAARVSGSTFTGNGAGISDESSGSTFTNVTIAGNRSDGFRASSITTGVITGATIANNGGTGISQGSFLDPRAGLTVHGSIISNNARGNCDLSVGQSDSGVFRDSGYNLERDAVASCMFSTANHDLVGVDPQLGPLQDNGGPTETMRPLLASPAVNAIPNPTTALCPGTDQRGVARPQGAGCDIGAVERGIPAPGPPGVIFAVTFPNCTALHVGYNRFPNGTVVRWAVSATGLGQVATGSFTAIGGGDAGSKTFHFLTQPLGTMLPSDPAHSHIHFTWPEGGKYVVTRNPKCAPASPAPTAAGSRLL